MWLVWKLKLLDWNEGHFNDEKRMPFTPHHPLNKTVREAREQQIRIQDYCYLWIEGWGVDRKSTWVDVN